MFACVGVLSFNTFRGFHRQRQNDIAFGFPGGKESWNESGVDVWIEAIRALRCIKEPLRHQTAYIAYKPHLFCV